ncbi:MAG TPA: DUF1963 domain-containing protein [Ktedonosporobacter sp.]|jgi:hypothetical protein|nr:DUF1963 domain-containing protein [Ktedonosporobacter sp.]
MIHERLDLSYWKNVCSLQRLRDASGGKIPALGGMTGPCDIAALEQLRDLTYAHLPAIKRVPTDIFLWSLGETDQRMVTRIGGLPYRAAHAPWPVSPSGVPLTFVAQICFADSRDLVPKLPGDILLIFTEARNWGSADKPLYDFMGEDEDDSYLLFEWVMFHDFPLVTHQHVPETGLHITPCYGTIHRTWDYAQVDGFAYRELAESIPPVINATKIGGICPWSDYYWVLYIEEEHRDYLCSVRSLDHEHNWPFPFLNVPRETDLHEWYPLTIGDVGLINLFLQQDGTIRWRFHG